MAGKVLNYLLLVLVYAVRGFVLSIPCNVGFSGSISIELVLFVSVDAFDDGLTAISFYQVAMPTRFQVFVAVQT
jgi:hypothetical protein